MAIPPQIVPYATAAPIALMLASVPLILGRVRRNQLLSLHARRDKEYNPYFPNQKIGLTLLYSGLAMLAVVLFLIRL